MQKKYEPMTAAIQAQQVQLANQFVIFLFKEIIVTATDFSIVMTVFTLQYYREKSTKVQPKYGRGGSCTCRPVAMQTAMIATLQGWEPKLVVVEELQPDSGINVYSVPNKAISKQTQTQSSAPD